MIAAAQRWWERFKATPVGRGWDRYSNARGNLLAGGVAYFAFFSIFPALVLAFTVAALILRGQPELLERLQSSISEALPGFVKTADNQDGLISLEPPGGGTLGSLGAIGVAGLAWAGLGWLGALRDGMRTIFGAAGAPGNPVVVKLRDMLVLLTIGVCVLLSVAVSVVASAVATEVAGFVGLGDQTWIVGIVGFVVQVVLNSAVVLVLLRLLSGVAVPWSGLRNGAIFGGVTLTVLQLFGTTLIALTMRNPVFGAIGLVVGLLAFLNFISRVLLISAAWAANDLEARQTTTPVKAAVRVGSTTGSLPGAAPVPATAGPADPAVRAAAGLPTFGQRTVDRTTLAAGAVLGASATAGISLLGRGIRALGRR